MFGMKGDEERREDGKRTFPSTLPPFKYKVNLLVIVLDVKLKLVFGWPFGY